MVRRITFGSLGHFSRNLKNALECPERGCLTSCGVHHSPRCKRRAKLAAVGVRQFTESGGSVWARELGGDPNLIDCSPAAEGDRDGFVVIPDFVSVEEEHELCQDIKRTLRGRQYQYDHWDKLSTSCHNIAWGQDIITTFVASPLLEGIN